MSMELWQKFEKTAPEAQKAIEAGRLKGFTDINPMWRFKRLTEVFGPVGNGWKYEITKKEIIPGADGVVSAFVDILLYYKQNGEWSDGIPGTGGSSFVAKERSGLYTSDECFKMALSDAIGTACKALGMSADIYFSKDRSKYNTGEPAVDPAPKRICCTDCGGNILPVKFGEKVYAVEEIIENTTATYGAPLCWKCAKERASAAAGGDIK